MPMMCPYCVSRVHAEEPAETRGSFRVHRFCQITWERKGTFLLTDGALRVHAHEIAPKPARDLVLMSMNFKIEERARIA